MGFIHADKLTPEVAMEIDDVFDYHPWDEGQKSAGMLVRSVLADAVKVLIEHVPPCADRTTAIRKLREARMDANSAITHRGKY